MLEKFLGRAHPKEQSEEKERILSSNRVVVFGSNTSVWHHLPDLRNDLDQLGLVELQIKQEKNIYYLPEGFYGNYPTKEDPEPTRSLPYAVILLPEMRQYSETGTGMFVPTYQSDVPQSVERMCTENNVPLIKILEGYSPSQTRAELEKLRPQQA